MNPNHLSRESNLPAPCLVDSGIVVNKQDMQRLLADLGRVHYCYKQDDYTLSEGEGHILEVFADPVQSTLVANNSLYINVYSFDYMEMGRSLEAQSYFELVQENRRLRLIPLSSPLDDQFDRGLNAAALEAVVAEVLSANWDAQMDDDGFSM